MKFLLSLILTMCGVATVQAQELDEYERHDLQLKIFRADSIKQMQIYKFNIARKGKTVDSILIKRIIFDYGANGSTSERHELLEKKPFRAVNYACVFNQSGDILKRTISIDQPKKEGAIFEFDYDSLSRKTFIVQYNLDTSAVTNTQRIYNSEGKWVKTMEKYTSSRFLAPRLTMNSKLALSDSLYYDKGGLLYEIRHYAGYNTPDAFYFYEYSGTEYKTITVTKQRNNTQHVISKNKYNKAGQIISSMLSPFSNPFDSPPDDQTIWKYYYNTDGTFNICICYHNGQTQYILKYYYTKE